MMNDVEMYDFVCPVCGERYMADYYEFEICRKCGWEDDPLMVKYPDLHGANGDVTFNQAIENYKRTGRALPG